MLLVACGGRVGEIGVGGTGGDDSGAGDSGGGEAGAVCPDPGQVMASVACPAPGLSCPSSQQIYDCNGPTGPVTCSCSPQGWACPVPLMPSCPPPPPTGCPDPSSIREGASCSTSPTLTCSSDIRIVGVCPGSTTLYATCSCQQNAWACATVMPLPAAACPNPTTLTEGTACSSPGQQCRGNPMSCGGPQTFYDAFQCSSACQWSRVAATDCLDASAPNSE